MDLIKEAFSKVKNDMVFLNSELSILRAEIEELRREMLEISQFLREITLKTPKKQHFDTSTHKPENSTISTYSSTHPLPLKPPEPQNLVLSTGNQGVSTDRQTDTPTDNNEQKTSVFYEKFNKLPENQVREKTSIENAAEILDSLDNLKKEIRLKFKMLTDQEVLVFSTLYQLEETQGHVDYKTLSEKLNLTESSIRDYIGRLIKKGIPVEKRRINNKQILLSISPNLKKIASLATILQLRDI
jgi:predicted transcriptional regulator